MQLVQRFGVHIVNRRCSALHTGATATIVNGAESSIFVRLLPTDSGNAQLENYSFELAPHESFTWLVEESARIVAVAPVDNHPRWRATLLEVQ